MQMPVRPFWLWLSIRNRRSRHFWSKVKPTETIFVNDNRKCCNEIHLRRSFTKKRIQISGFTRNFLSHSIPVHLNVDIGFFIQFHYMTVKGTLPHCGFYFRTRYPVVNSLPGTSSGYYFKWRKKIHFHHFFVIRMQFKVYERLSEYFFYWKKHYSLSRAFLFK